MTPEGCETDNWTLVSVDGMRCRRKKPRYCAKVEDAGGARPLFHGACYQGIANTIVQLIRRSTLGVISSIATDSVGRAIDYGRPPVA